MNLRESYTNEALAASAMSEIGRVRLLSIAELGVRSRGTPAPQGFVTTGARLVVFSAGPFVDSKITLSPKGEKFVLNMGGIA